MTLAFAEIPVPLATDIDGVIRVGGTRVTLETLVAAYDNGTTADHIAQQFPSLALADIYVAIGFILHHRDEVDAYVRQRQDQAALVQARHGTHTGVRERLLARNSRARS